MCFLHLSSCWCYDDLVSKERWCCHEDWAGQFWQGCWMLPNPASLLPPRMTHGFSKALWHLLCAGQGVGDVAPSDADVKGHPQNLLSGFKLEV